MRYLFITDHIYLPQQVGGTKSSTHDLCLSLIERERKVGVLCRLGARDGIGLRHRALRRLAPWLRPTRDRWPGYPVWRDHEVTDDHVRAVVRRFAPDLLVIQAIRPSCLIEAALDTGLPAIVYLRDVEVRNLDGPLAPHPRLRYVANSRFTAGRYRDLFGIDAVPIPPLVRPERFVCKPDGSSVVFVNPVPEKGLDIALALAEARPDIRFLFVAGWPLGPAASERRRARIARLPNVTWLPEVLDMRTIYGRARLLLVPSQWEEAWGRVVTEAQASGIPVLASDRGGLPESVGPGGVVVPAGAPVEHWRAALSGMWDDPARLAALGRAAARHAARPEIRPAEIIATFDGTAAMLCADMRSRHSPPAGAAVTAAGIGNEAR